MVGSEDDLFTCKFESRFIFNIDQLARFRDIMSLMDLKILN